MQPLTTMVMSCGGDGSNQDAVQRVQRAVDDDGRAANELAETDGVAAAGETGGETTSDAPRWGAVTGWADRVDPLRSGDIFSRSWASPIPVRARN